MTKETRFHGTPFLAINGVTIKEMEATNQNYIVLDMRTTMSSILWGCIQARLSFTADSNLFTYGKWLNQEGDWQFDKNRIKHELEKTIFQYRFCPAIDLSLVQDVLAAFPDTVNPQKDKNWEYVRNWRSEEGLRIVEEKYGYKEVNYMNGTIPKNMSDFVNEISTRINRKLPLARS